jgi:tetratricopeptide (TPR) repeat protein
MRQKTDKIVLAEHGVVREEALLAYLNNELGADDVQQMEKLLADDPFAQEALEGLKQTTRATAAAAVVNINRQVRERTGAKEARIVKLHWSTYAWAAVVLGLLIGVGFIMVTFIGNKSQNNIAMNEPAKQENVNLLEEQKPATPEIVSAAPTTDSAAVSIPPVQSLTDANAVSPTDVSGKKDAGTTKADNNNIALNGTSATVSANNVGAVSTPGTYLMNSTLVADDKGTAPASKPIVNAGRADSKQTAPEKKVQDNVDMDVITVTGSKYEKSKSKAPAPELNKDKQVAAYTTQPVVRGGIIEKEEADRVTVITMDDAMKSFNNQDYKTSSEQFGEILKQQPNNADALYFGGISDYLNGNTKKSEKNFDKLLKEGNRYAEGSKWYKANILLKKGKKDEAKKLLDELANSSGSYRERAIKKKAEIEF